jgi:hypothetical protein
MDNLPRTGLGSMAKPNAEHAPLRLLERPLPSPMPVTPLPPARRLRPAAPQWRLQLHRLAHFILPAR